jgi:hypothetical protein
MLSFILKTIYFFICVDIISSKELALKAVDRDI